MKLVRESLDGHAPVHISHDGLQAHVCEVELSCWCAEAEHSGKVYVCLEDVRNSRLQVRLGPRSYPRHY
jgi:hypothetical protein